MLPDRYRADEFPTINMTPMVDVILCLLIFFMAATKLYDWDDQQFEVRVPEVGKAAPLIAAPEDLEVTIVAPGQVDVQGRKYDLSGLTRLLTDAHGRYSDQGVLVRGDASLAYQDLADVLSACETAGIRNVRLPVRPRDGGAVTR